MVAKTGNITLADIARKVNMSKSAVSKALLGGGGKTTKVSEKSMLKIRKAAEELGYVPNASARALSTQRTYQIGYLVSSKVTLGLANSTFSTYMAGVADSCQNRGYRMMASAYDMSKVENFIVLDNLRQRCVDGLILAGLFNDKIIKELGSLDIPVIFIGGNDSKEILCLRSNMHETYLKMLDYLKNNGHKNICFASSLDYVNKVFRESGDKFCSKSKNKLNIEFKSMASADEFQSGKLHAEKWLNLPKESRYTCFISNEQACCGFLSKILDAGLKCPDDISIFSNIDSYLCRENAIPISAPGSSLFDRGELASNLLIDLIEKKKSKAEIKEILKQEYYGYELKIRKTTGIAANHQGGVS